MTTRRVAFAVVVALVAATIGVTAATGQSTRATNHNLRVIESTTTFDVHKLSLKEGVHTFTVIVPKTAKYKHGVGIDGNGYNNIDGAVVGPGKRTSLTVQLTPGKYTVYDSKGKNRQRGYRVKVTVN